MNHTSERLFGSFRPLFLWTLLIFLVPLAVALTISLLYWGYVIHPPPLHAELKAINQITSVEYYHTAADIGSIPTFSDLRQRAKSSSSPETRILASLLQSEVSLPHQILRASSQRGALLELASLSESIHHGLFIVGLNDDRDEVIFFSGTGFPLDHRCYTEVVFARDANDPTPKVVDLRSFNFDSAGLEYLTPPKLYLFATLGSIVMSCSLLLVSLVRRKRSGHSTKARCQQT